MKTISINKLHPFKDHPYKVLDNDEMNSLIGSVQEHGILSPLIVRPLEGVTGEYEIDGYGFDTMIPETVDMQTVAQAAGTLMDEQQLSMPFQILTSVDAEQSFLKLWVVP